MIYRKFPDICAVGRVISVNKKKNVCGLTRAQKVLWGHECQNVSEILCRMYIYNMYSSTYFKQKKNLLASIDSTFITNSLFTRYILLKDFNAINIWLLHWFLKKEQKKYKCVALSSPHIDRNNAV